MTSCTIYRICSSQLTADYENYVHTSSESTLSYLKHFTADCRLLPIRYREMKNAMFNPSILIMCHISFVWLCFIFFNFPIATDKSCSGGMHVFGSDCTWSSKTQKPKCSSSRTLKISMTACTF